MGAGLRAQIEKYNNIGLGLGGLKVKIGEGPLPILQYILYYIYTYYVYIYILYINTYYI